MALIEKNLAGKSDSVGIDPFQIDDTAPVNSLNYLGRFNPVYLGSGTSTMETVFYREGRGVIHLLEAADSHEIELWVDGGLHLRKTANSGTSSQPVIGADNNTSTPLLPYLPYSKSIEIRLRDVYSGTRESYIYHLMTGA